VFLESIRKLDMFGINIKMTYEGYDSFKTLFGAIISIMVGVILVSFFTYKALIMFNRLDAKTSKQSFIKNLHDEPPFYLHKYGFSLAFTAQNPVEEA
jgi:hypothetical protein